MDRTEAKGFGIALAGHAALLAALSMGLADSTTLPVLNEPMEVSLVDDVALESSAPLPSEEAPAARLAEVEGPVEPAPPPVPVPEPQPLPQPKAIEPAPAPKPAGRPRPPKPAPARPSLPKAAPKAAAPAKPQPVPKQESRPTGRLKGLLDGVGERDTDSRASAPPAATISAAVRSSLAGEVRRQLKPHWKAPTGVDVEQLRTELSISLAPSGAVTDVKVLRTTGQTDSNRPQVKLHQEQAVRAVRLASPFRLPAEFYEAWKLLSPIGFDKRLSQ